MLFFIIHSSIFFLIVISVSISFFVFSVFCASFSISELGTFVLVSVSFSLSHSNMFAIRGFWSIEVTSDIDNILLSIPIPFTYILYCSTIMFSSGSSTSLTFIGGLFSLSIISFGELL